MANETIEPQELESPEDLLSPEGGSRYEKYKRDDVYEYGVLPNGKRDKSRVKITYNAGDVFEGVLKHGKYVGTGKYREATPRTAFRPRNGNGQLNAERQRSARNGYDGQAR